MNGCRIFASKFRIFLIIWIKVKPLNFICLSKLYHFLFIISALEEHSGYSMFCGKIYIQLLKAVPLVDVYWPICISGSILLKNILVWQNDWCISWMCAPNTILTMLDCWSRRDWKITKLMICMNFQVVKALIEILKQAISDEKQKGELRIILMMRFTIVDALL